MSSNASRRGFLERALGCGAVVSVGAQIPAAVAQTSSGSGGVNVRDHGATGDGGSLETVQLQKAIDACARGGGGTVHFPAGTYRSGTLLLRSHVTLRLDAGATLQGSGSLEDYPANIPALRSYTDNYTEKSLLYGEGLENVAIEGSGCIDGQGARFKGPYKVRPYLVRLISCRNIAVRGITLKNSPMWVQHYLACENLLIDGVVVESRCNQNNDGIDIDGCRRVRIANCDIRSGDDAIVLKSTLDRPCSDVAITNCLLSSDCNAFKLGTESNGGFESIVMSNCTIYDTRLAGLALEIVDGGRLDGVSVSGIIMRKVNCPVFIRLGNRARPFKEGMPAPGLGSLRNVSIRDILAEGADRIGCSITGLPEQRIEGVALENVRIRFPGGGTADDAGRPVQEFPEKYPEYKMFGTLPACGFYCRHVQGLRLSNVRVGLAAADERPSLMCEDVEELELFGWSAAAAPSVDPVIRFREVRDAWIHGCRSPKGATVFLGVEGARSANIRLAANELSGAKQVRSLGSGAAQEEVITGMGDQG